MILLAEEAARENRQSSLIVLCGEREPTPKPGINITHTAVGEEPRLFYMHFWVNDGAETLAEGLQAALDETNSS